MIRPAVAVAALIDEAIAGIWRARRLTVVSIVQIGVAITLVGVFLLLAENLRGVVEAVREESVVTVFLRRDATEDERRELERLVAASRLVERSRRVSPDEARARFASSWESLAAVARSLPASPFPETLELDLMKDALGSEALKGFLELLSRQRAAEEVQFDVEWIRRLRSAVSLVRAGGIFLGAVLAFGAAFTIANVVRLTILLHRDEIEILRLVGAPEILIRGPFLAGALAQGLLGGLAALGLLAVSFHAVTRWVAATHNTLLSVFVVRFLSPSTSALLVLGGLVAGLLGGAIAVRRRNLVA